MQKLLASAAAVILLSLWMSSRLSDSTTTALTLAKADHHAKAAARGGDVVLDRSRNGHFFADVEVNGTSIHMIADTGATVVALSAEDAEAAGINVDALDFDHGVSTANGEGHAAAVMLDEVTVGSITRYNVQAVVIREMSGSLLGMSFFNTLSKVAMEADEMVLED